MRPDAYRTLALLAALISICGSDAVAATRRVRPTRGDSAPPPSGIVVLERNGTGGIVQDDPSSPSSGYASGISMGIATWAPGSLSLPSNLPVTTAFRAASMPGLYFAWSKPAFAPDVSLRLGGSWVGLERQGQIVIGGAAASGSASMWQTQSLHLFSVRAGLEYSPSGLALRWVEPVIAASLVPSFGVATRSGFEARNSYFGFMGEVMLGARVPVSRGWALEATGVGTLGSLDQGRADGWGINAGLRVNL